MNVSKRLLASVFLIVGILCSVASVMIAQDEGTEEPQPQTTETVSSDTDDATPSDTSTVDILDQDIEVAIEPTGDNGYCTICHDQPLRTTRLADGTILNLYVNPEMIIGSVHGPTEDSPGLGCLDCHGEDAFPHNELPPADGRVYTLESVSLCTSCHETQAEDLDMGLHAQAISEGNLQAAVCTDCHGAHHVQSAENFPELVAGVCGDCHENTLAEWQISPHAEIGPLGCASCHSHHEQTLRVGETSTDLCVNCHGDMPSFHAHDVHLDGENPVACVDCHMYREDDTNLVSAIDMESTGHSMFLDSTPCTTCHAELEASGEWQELISARYGVEVSAPVDESDADAITAVPEDEADADNGVATIQGLLVGLGLGATLTIVFATRTGRRETE